MKRILLFCFTFLVENIDVRSLIFLEYWLLSHFCLKHVVIVLEWPAINVHLLYLQKTSQFRKSWSWECTNGLMLRATRDQISQPQSTMVPWGNFYHLLIQHFKISIFRCLLKLERASLICLYNLFLSLPSSIYLCDISLFWLQIHGFGSSAIGGCKSRRPESDVDDRCLISLYVCNFMLEKWWTLIRLTPVFVLSLLSCANALKLLVYDFL